LPLSGGVRSKAGGDENLIPPQWPDQVRVAAAPPLPSYVEAAVGHLVDRIAFLACDRSHNLIESLVQLLQALSFVSL